MGETNDQGQLGGIVFSMLLVCGLVVALAAGALWNGFPLLFPDSGTYLAIAFGHEYAIDRSSFYGLALKPLVNSIPDIRGLWLAIVVQIGVVAAILANVARTMVKPTPWLLLLPLMLLFTSAPWHVGQFMPDAVTAALVLLVWSAARRDLTQSGTLLCWLLAFLLGTMHYTHVALLAATAAGVLVADWCGGATAGAILRRSVAAGVTTMAAIAVLVAANGAVLGRWSVSPLGSVFLFARLNEDGLIPHWLDARCGRGAPAAICAERAAIPHNSQTLLWRAPDGIVSRHIWNAAAAERWRWAEMMAAANRGAIAAQPRAFAGASLRGAVRQLATFQVLDDECPLNCLDPNAGIGATLLSYRPPLAADFRQSGQGRGSLPKQAIRAISTPIASIGLIALPIILALGWRRRDRFAMSLVAGLLTALAVNALITGALSDVHDRYQSRLVWLAPAVLLLIVLRWRQTSSAAPTRNRENGLGLQSVSPPGRE